MAVFNVGPKTPFSSVFMESVFVQKTGRLGGNLALVKNPALKNTPSINISHKTLPLDYGQILGANRILGFCDEHELVSVKLRLAEDLPRLKSLGITHLGLEMFYSDMQDILDEYVTRGKNFELIAKHLKDNWSHEEVAHLGYIELVKSARKYGLRIIALDVPKRIDDENDEERRQKNKVADLDFVVLFRNKFMASVIEHTLAETDSKIAILIGKAHYNGNASVKSLLANCGIVTADFFGGKIFCVIRGAGGSGYLEVTPVSPLEETLHSTDLAKKLFMLNNDAKLGISYNLEYNWLIHLPEIEPPNAAEVALAKKRFAWGDRGSYIPLPKLRISSR